MQLDLTPDCPCSSVHGEARASRQPPACKLPPARRPRSSPQPHKGHLPAAIWVAGLPLPWAGSRLPGSIAAWVQEPGWLLSGAPAAPCPCEPRGAPGTALAPGPQPHPSALGLMDPPRPLPLTPTTPGLVPARCSTDTSPVLTQEKFLPVSRAMS